jgi:hypothetical protein
MRSGAHLITDKSSSPELSSHSAKQHDDDPHADDFPQDWDSLADEWNSRVDAEAAAEETVLRSLQSVDSNPSPNQFSSQAQAEAVAAFERYLAVCSNENYSHEKARAVWNERMKEGHDPEAIIASRQRYEVKKGKIEPRYIKRPHTFLEEQSWVHQQAKNFETERTRQQNLEASSKHHERMIAAMPYREAILREIPDYEAILKEQFARVS